MAIRSSNLMPGEISGKFNSISPSALALLKSRSFTAIPYAKEAYQIISRPKSNTINDELSPPRNALTSSQFNFGLGNQTRLSKEMILRIMHFETRYLSIDKGIRLLGSNHILEFSSGFSFRGLDICRNPAIHYVDTDLAEIIEIKKELLDEIIKNYCEYQCDNLILDSMNVLKEEEFSDILEYFPNGPISIVNEGFLMYLNLEQKIQLCNNIHKILSRYGGYWITADIYRRDDAERKNIDRYYNQHDRDFVQKHNIESNKFSTFQEAKELFSNCGFETLKTIELNLNELSSSKILKKHYPSTVEESLTNDNNRETWILKPI